MPVLLIENDPFVEAIGELVDGNTGTGVKNVRRPLWGMVSKSVRMAYLTVVTKDGKTIGTYNSSAPGGVGAENSNFLMSAVEISRQERAQILSTFGDTYTFFFGQTPQVLSISGFLFNTTDFNWKEEWLENYENYLRGTRCVETRSRVYLGFDDTLVEGYILGTGASLQSEQPDLAPFNFSLLVTNWVSLSMQQQREQPASAGYVYTSESARTLGGESGTHVEYPLGQPEAVHQDTVQYNAISGEYETSEPVSASSNTPMDERIPSWVADWNSRNTAFLSEEEALREIDLQSYMSQKSVERMPAIIKWADDPTQFPLSSRKDFTTDLGKSLGKNASNSASVIPAQPTPS